MPALLPSPFRRTARAATLLLAAAGTAAAATAAADPLGPWRAGVAIREVSGTPGRHAAHAYYLASPESPDGTRVLFFTSSTPDAHRGDLVVRERSTGRETVIARGIDTEDAHRGACQQWISQGRRVAYHDVKHGRWSVHVVDLDTLRDRIVAEGRQLCFGRAVDDWLPIYGCHWNPGPHRNLELVHAGTGEIKTVVTIEDVERRYGAYLAKEFGGRTTSIFFPHLSPDGKRVFFKMSAPGPDGAANHFMSKNASHRQGLFVYEVDSREPLFMSPKWGHPAWHPDSRRIIEMGNLFYDTSDGGKVIRMANLPVLRGNHPSVGPDGKLFVMDGLLDQAGGPPGLWGVALCDVRGDHHVILHRFDNSRGAKSWRKSHPHPIFSADGRRIYFNVNEGEWTRLFVAERGGQG